MNDVVAKLKAEKESKNKETDLTDILIVHFPSISSNAFNSLDEWRIWRNQSHVIAMLLHSLMAIPIVHLLSMTSPLPCSLTSGSWEGWRIWRRQSHVSCSLPSRTSQPFIVCLTLAMPCPLASDSWDSGGMENFKSWRRRSLAHVTWHVFIAYFLLLYLTYGCQYRCSMSNRR